ncbi:MAG: Lrp/AsnC family transcriptional regulator [Pseudomonadota bacterium]
MKKIIAMVIDEFDQAILEIVQRDNQRSHASIGEDVNLSASSVRRRLAKMRESGVITADVSLVDPAKQGLTFIVHVSFAREDPEIYTAFKAQMIADPTVSQCYHISGDEDFVLIVHATNPEAFELWGTDALMANGAIRRYSTSLVWSRSKFTTHIMMADRTS